MAKYSHWSLIAESAEAKRLRKQTIALKIGKNSVGRSKQCDLFIPSKVCSRHHCDIVVDGEMVKLIDHVRHRKQIFILCLFLLHPSSL